MLISKEFKRLKIGFGAMTVKSHKFWALLYSSHGEMKYRLGTVYFLGWGVGGGGSETCFTESEPSLLASAVTTACSFCFSSARTLISSTKKKKDR